MITRFITEVATKVNPFSPKSKSVRLFLNSLPAQVRSQGTAVSTKMLPQSTVERNALLVKFKDGKTLDLDCENMTIQSLIDECDRHSRFLQKQADLNDG